jgi:integrase
VLNDAFIRSAPPGIHWDKSLRGLGLRVGKNRKTFIVLVASGRRKSIATWPLCSLADARKMARELIAHKMLKRSFPTRTAYADALADFLRDCEKRNKPRTVRDYRRLLTKHYSFGRQSLADITGRVILRNLNALPPSERHHAFTAGRRFFRYCVQNHLIDRSPLADAAVSPASRPRTRTLTEEELRAVWKASRTLATPFHAILSLLVLTGQRRGEIARLEWAWIDQEKMLITFPAHATKNGRIHSIPYGPNTEEILQSLPRYHGGEFVFPAARLRSEKTTTFNGWGKPKAHFDVETGVTGWTLHDLRRTFATNLQRLGVRLEVTEALLNHVSGTRSGIVGVYQQHQWADEKREAIQRFEAYLTNL